MGARVHEHGWSVVLEHGTWALGGVWLGRSRKRARVDAGDVGGCAGARACARVGSVCARASGTATGLRERLERQLERPSVREHARAFKVVTGARIRAPRRAAEMQLSTKST
ncbi:hypothetical protein CDL15_Pgr026286 [Punica granatum]|uniref:Uncharacterized protein n=1 Tax=Punica granatum TaxID=22663 RepID=A0A218XVX4_PUNGR|nr:hypothetical protein CDL15_Pgr026286 [Punica granatum]PKI47135.1 hypothetical protein CRG98_032477 [Punica granatum]